MGRCPQKPLTVGLPVSVRPPGNAQLNNQVLFTLSRLPTDVAEPLPRLAAAQAAGQEAKNLFTDMRDLVTTEISILGAPLFVMGLTRLWAGARAANYLSPFINVAISNVPGPRQTMYCVGAPATHYFPVSIPYHGCALNITVQSYVDQLDFGLVACSDTVPDAQRIADYIVDDFAAMRKSDADLSRPEAVETIAVAARPAAVAAHNPIELGEAKAELHERQVKKVTRVDATHRCAGRGDRVLDAQTREGSTGPAPEDARCGPARDAATGGSPKASNARASGEHVSKGHLGDAE